MLSLTTTPTLEALGMIPFLPENRLHPRQILAQQMHPGGVLRLAGRHLKSQLEDLLDEQPLLVAQLVRRHIPELGWLQHPSALIPPRPARRRRAPRPRRGARRTCTSRTACGTRAAWPPWPPRA